MKIYITTDNKKEIKRFYKGLINKHFAVIDISLIADEMEYDMITDDMCANFVLSKEVEKRIINFYNSKRFHSLLYVIERLDQGFVSNFKKYLESKNVYFTEYFLLDPDQKIDPKIYKHFNNVL